MFAASVPNEAVSLTGALAYCAFDIILGKMNIKEQLAHGDA